jgi:hypothetical protein
LLNYILTDTTEIRLVKDGRKVISDIDILGPANFTGNFSDYLSKELKEKDIAYINRQLKQAITFKTDELTKFGFTVVKASELLERKISGDKFWDKIDNDYGPGGLLIISCPIFNKDMTKAYVRFGHRCGTTCGSGEDFIIELIDNKWVITERLGGWVS